MATKPAPAKTVDIKLAHSPDSDDAFMFYGLATQKVRTPGLKFTHVLADIETLNQAAMQEIYDVTAFQLRGLPLPARQVCVDGLRSELWRGLRSDRSVQSATIKRADGREVPNWRAGTANVGLSDAFKLYEPRIEAVPMAFDKILDAVKNAEVDAGLLIHEGQLLFSQLGMHKVVDLGVWWLEQTGLPLPLGANGVRRALGPDVGKQIAGAIRESVTFSMEHREALNHAMKPRDM